MRKKWLIMSSHCCIFCTSCKKTALVTLKSPCSPLQLTTTQAERGIWSHHKNQELLCQRDWCSRREEKLAENQCCVTGKDLQVGGEQGEVGKEGLREELGLKWKRDALERVKGGWGEDTRWIKVNDKIREKSQEVEEGERHLWLWRRENGSVDRGGERHFLWLQAQLVSMLDRCGCQIFIPTLETAGGVNAAPASVMLPHKTQPCVCAHSSPTVTTSRHRITFSLIL